MKRAVKTITRWNNNDLTSVVFLSCFFSERYKYTLSPLFQKLTLSNAQPITSRNPENHNAPSARTWHIKARRKIIKNSSKLLGRSQAVSYPVHSYPARTIRTKPVELFRSHTNKMFPMLSMSEERWMSYVNSNITCV